MAVFKLDFYLVEEFDVLIGILDKRIRMGLEQFLKMKYMKYE